MRKKNHQKTKKEKKNQLTEKKLEHFFSARMKPTKSFFVWRGASFFFVGFEQGVG